MAGRGSGPDFVEALARGLDILVCFDARRPTMTLSEVAVAAGLARPTARRLLLTLAELGYVRVEDGAYALTPRVLGLGTAYTSSLGLWELARPHLEALVHQTGESSSMAQLDGSDIVYVARVAVPKIIALRVDIGTRFPAERTSQGKVLLAALPESEVARVVAEPSRSGLPPAPERPLRDLQRELTRVARAEGIRVVGVRPGLIATEIHAPGRLERLGSSPPLGRPGRPEEVAAAIVWLASPVASYVTGATLDVGGGR